MFKLKTFLKENKKEVIIFIIVFLISSASFLLGYLYATELEPIPIIIEKCSE